MTLGVDAAMETRRSEDYNRGWRDGQAALQQDFQGQFGVVRSVVKVIWGHLDEVGKRLLIQRDLAPDGAVEASALAVGETSGEAVGVVGAWAPITGVVTRWAIIGEAELDDDGTPLWWSNTDGWVDRESADLFSSEEKDRGSLNLPIGGRWEPAG